MTLWVRRVNSAAGTVGAIALSAVLVAACASTPTPSASADPAGASSPVALTSSSTSSVVTWATLPMGHLDDPLNTFWQLFHLPAGSSHWVLSTPAGVASNGGLVASQGGTGSVLTGFEPATDLHFSPLASSTDLGADWVTGLLPAGLAPVPDSLAAPAPAGGRSLALLRTAGGTVVSNGGDLVTWATVVTRRALASGTGASPCRLTALTAVSSGPGGEPLVGGACASGSGSGLFESVGGAWRTVGPSSSLPASGPSLVLRLRGTADGLVALVRRGGGPSTRLFAVSSTDGLATWTVSGNLPVGGDALVSTGTTTAGGYVVVTRSPSGTLVASTEDPTSGRWSTLAPLPGGTSSVVATPAGGFDALIAHQSTLLVDTLGPGGWSRIQTLGVDIQYGSSG